MPIRKTVFGVIAFVMFFLMIGTVGAVECDTLPLGSGMVQAFVYMGLWVLFSWLAGAFEPITERSEPLEVPTKDPDARSSGTSREGYDPYGRAKDRC